MSSTSGVRDEQPLDPALIRVQKRLRRLMIISVSTLGLGVVAVLAAIIYRFFIMDSSGGTPPATQEEAFQPPPATGAITAETLGLRPDAELVEQTLDGDRMAFTYRDGADLVTFIVDINTMEVVGQFRMAAE